MSTVIVTEPVDHKSNLRESLVTLYILPSPVKFADKMYELVSPSGFVIEIVSLDNDTPFSSDIEYPGKQ